MTSPTGASAKARAQVATALDYLTRVYNDSIQDVIEVMQEPGPSVAASRKSVARGEGLGKVKTNGQRGRSKRAYGPVPNFGGSGNLPFDTGFLRASLVVGIGEVVAPLTYPPEDAENQAFVWRGEGMEVVGQALITDPIEARYTAAYARAVEYGTGKRRGRAFVRLAWQQWPQIVSRNLAKAKDTKGSHGGPQWKV